MARNFSGHRWPEWIETATKRAGGAAVKDFSGHPWPESIETHGFPRIRSPWRISPAIDGRSGLKVAALPHEVKAQAPTGDYNSDLAIIKEEQGRAKLYLIRETKGSTEPDDLRGKERKRPNAPKPIFKASESITKVAKSQRNLAFTPLSSQSKAKFRNRMSNFQ